MLKRQWKNLLLFTLICTFEVLSLYMVSKIMTDNIRLVTLLPIYIIPFVLVRFFQFKSGSLPSIYMVVPFLQLILLFLTGYSTLSILIVGAFIFWRMIVHIREPYLDNQGIWLVALLASAFPILLLRKEFLMEFVLLFLLLIFLFVGITIMIQLKGNAWRFMKKGYRILSLYFIGAVGIFLLIYHSGLTLLKTVFPVFGQGVAYLASYPLMWMFKLFKPSDDSYKDIEKSIEKLQEDPMKNASKNFDGNNEGLLLALIVMGIILVFGIIIYFLRKSIGSSLSDSEHNADSNMKDNEDFSILKSLRKVSSFYSRTGRNEVRIQFQKLQTYLHKRGYGRLPAETAEEWFMRLDIYDTYSESVLTTYYKSRYSNIQFLDEELASYSNGIKEIKKKLAKKDGGKKK